MRKIQKRLEKTVEEMRTKKITKIMKNQENEEVHGKVKVKVKAREKGNGWGKGKDKGKGTG